MNTNDRLARLEAVIKPKRCATCTDWPYLETLLDERLVGGESAPASTYPTVCPDCGRQGPMHMIFQVVPAREA
jgi:hypothetical protein